jgi:hypothetical protein
MAAIGLTEAARLSGRDRLTLHRAMRAGRLSFKTNAAGDRRIDVAELERVFGLRGAAGASVQRNDSRPGEQLAAQLDALQRLLDSRESTIADLWRHLDAESEERRRVQASRAAFRRLAVPMFAALGGAAGGYDPRRGYAVLWRVVRAGRVRARPVV